MGRQSSWSMVPHSVRMALRAYVFERDGFRCQIRGPRCSALAEELDHIRPRAQGGALLDAANLRAACRLCNAGRRPVRSRERRPLPAPVPSRRW